MLENLCVGHFVLPLHFQQFAKAVEMETIEFLCVSLIDSPGLAGIQQSSEDDGLVDTQFRCETHTLALPLR